MNISAALLRFMYLWASSNATMRPDEGRRSENRERQMSKRRQDVEASKGSERSMIVRVPGWGVKMSGRLGVGFLLLTEEFIEGMSRKDSRRLKRISIICFWLGLNVSRLSAALKSL